MFQLISYLKRGGKVGLSQPVFLNFANFKSNRRIDRTRPWYEASLVYVYEYTRRFPPPPEPTHRSLLLETSWMEKSGFGLLRCAVCGNADFRRHIVTCKCCGLNAHVFCLKPRLREATMPWRCSACASSESRGGENPIATARLGSSAVKTEGQAETNVPQTRRRTAKKRSRVGKGEFVIDIREFN